RTHARRRRGRRRRHDRASAGAFAMTADDRAALWLTFQLAAVSTAVLLLLGTPLAWWLARTRWRGRAIVEAAVALPLVLPPTVLGFYLLLALGPHGPLGALAAALGLPPLVFTFRGLVVGSLPTCCPSWGKPPQPASSPSARGVPPAPPPPARDPPAASPPAPR